MMTILIVTQQMHNVEFFHDCSSRSCLAFLCFIQDWSICVYWIDAPPLNSCGHSRKRTTESDDAAVWLRDVLDMSKRRAGTLYTWLDTCIEGVITDAVQAIIIRLYIELKIDRQNSRQTT